MDKVAKYCDTALSGVLRRGMISVFNSLFSGLRNEQKINNFTLRTAPPNQDLEVTILVSKVINNIIQEFVKGLYEITLSKVDMINVNLSARYFQILAALYLSYGIVAILVLLIAAPRVYQRELKIVKRFTLLVPSVMLILDYQTER